MTMIRTALIGAAILLFLGPRPARSSEASDPISRAKTVEAGLGSIAAEADRDSLLRELEGAEEGLRDHLAIHAGNSGDVALLMRLYMARVRFDAFRYLVTHEPGVLFTTEPYGTIVDRALSADPGNGLLHYFRGYLYSVHEPPEDGEFLPNPSLSDAVREMRRAAALDPSEASYRASLAYLLIGEGKYDEARSIYKDLLHGKHPAYELLSDWERMPDIEGTRITQRGAFLPEPLSAMLGFTDVRYRGFVYPGPAGEFEARCHELWPEFRLTERESHGQAGDERRQFAGHLVWKGGRLEPDPAGDAGPSLAGGGFWIEVGEHRATERVPAALRPGIEPGAVFCSVSIMDARPLEAEKESGSLRLRTTK